MDLVNPHLGSDGTGGILIVAGQQDGQAAPMPL